MSDDTWEIVPEIPTAKRGTNLGGPRDTEFSRFYNWLTSQPVGTKAKFKSGVHSPSYGGDKAKTRYPAVKMSARATGTETYTGRGGVEKTGPVYDLYGEHVGAPDQGGADGLIG